MLATPIGVITGHLFEALAGATGDLRQEIGLLGLLLLLLAAHRLALTAQLLGRLAADRAALDDGILLRRNATLLRSGNSSFIFSGAALRGETNAIVGPLGDVIVVANRVLLLTVLD